MRLPTLRFSFLRLSVAIAALALCGRTALGQDLRYLALQNPGQASVAIDRKKQVAFIIDLGKDRGGDQVIVENMSLMDWVANQGTRQLVFSCSHPHADHNGGIRKLFTNPRPFFFDDAMTKPRFESITLVDDGVNDSLFSILARSLPPGGTIKIHHESATNRNAFAALSEKGDAVFVENIAYASRANAGPHGRAVVTRIVLGGSRTILDFDDADSATIKKVVAVLISRGDTEVDSIVVPHHGSAYHDIDPIFQLKLKRAIFTVDPRNRYGHPAPSVLLKLMKQLGPENVYFTGSVSPLVMDPNNITAVTYTAAMRDSYALFVLPSRLRAQKRGKLSEADLAAYEEIRAIMMRDPGNPLPPNGNLGDAGGDASKHHGPASTPMEEKVKATGSLHSSEFEVGRFPVGENISASLSQGKVFTRDSGSEVSVGIERAANSESSNELTTSEARAALRRIQLANNSSPDIAAVKVNFETSAGFKNGFEQDLNVSRSEIEAFAKSRPTNPPNPPRPRPRKQRPGTGAPRQKVESLPEGGMVFLKGGRLFAGGIAEELLGGTVDLCGDKLCVTTGAGPSYTLPFSLTTLFAEVWQRRNVDAFYLSINPTKKFLREVDGDLENIPTDLLKFGTGAVEGHANEVVTAGNIDRSQIGRILWESDVAFKSASLGFDVFTGRSRVPTFQSLATQAAGKDETLNIPPQNRWCRLYWTSGDQSIKVNNQLHTISFTGNAVLAQAQAMQLRNGVLSDAPNGDWCGGPKLVAKNLQREANNGSVGRPVLNELRELAKMQSFVRWMQENQLSVSERLSQEITRVLANEGALRFEVPRWTSGIRSNPEVLVQYERRPPTFLVHFTISDKATLDHCVMPNWKRQYVDFPLHGLCFNEAKNLWENCRQPFTTATSPFYPVLNRPEPTETRGNFLDGWMANLAGNIVACTQGKLLGVTKEAADDEYSGLGVRQSFGLVPHPQPISLHGGVLLGAARQFFESAWRDKGLLISPDRKLLFKRSGDEVHFWNFVEDDPTFGLLGHHVVVTDARVTAAYANEGRLRFIIETNPSAVVRHEFRVARAQRSKQGLEWVEARHGNDGGLIFEKAAWPCVESTSKQPNCVGMADVSFESLQPAISKHEYDPLVAVVNINKTTWAVEMDVSRIAARLDEEWAKTKASDVDKRLSIVRSYAQWGFVRRATEKYKALRPSIEGNTQDTILMNELTATDGTAILKQLLIKFEQGKLMDSVGNNSISGVSVLANLGKIAKLIETLPPKDAAEVWDTQALICKMAQESSRFTPTQRKQILNLGELYSSRAIDSDFLANGVSNREPR